MKGRIGLDGWPTVDGPSAVGREQDRESSPVKYQRSTTVSRNQLIRIAAIIVAAFIEQLYNIMFYYFSDDNLFYSH